MQRDCRSACGPFGFSGFCVNNLGRLGPVPAYALLLFGAHGLAVDEVGIRTSLLSVPIEIEQTVETLASSFLTCGRLLRSMFPGSICQFAVWQIFRKRVYFFHSAHGPRNKPFLHRHARGAVCLDALLAAAMSSPSCRIFLAIALASALSFFQSL